MTNESSDSDERRQDLFVANLLFGLSPEERAELDTLLAAAPDGELRSLAEVIGLLDQVRSESDDFRLPESVRERIRANAVRELQRSARVGRRSILARPALPWTVAAASLLIALGTVAWFGLFRRPDDPSRMRDGLIASAGDLIREDWAPGPTPVSGASGDIAWSTSAQRGYMRFLGLRPNDPTVEQYQLWIFDRNQPEATPVDGGVFDVTSAGEVIVPIRPALRVREPYLFAVTIEKPGGVVVSDRSRLPLLATVSP